MYFKYVKSLTAFALAAVMVFFFSPLTSFASEAIEIYHPKPNEFVKKEMGHLVARVDTSLSPYVSVRVNENVSPVIDMTQPLYVESLGDVIIVRLYFVPGVNDIEVMGKNAEGVDVARAEFKVYLGESFDNSSSSNHSDFVKSPFHVSSREELCTGCHRMKVDSAVDMAPVKKFDIFCTRCHESSLVGFQWHGGAEWKCLYCHNYEAADKYGLYDEKGTFCGNCHAEMAASFVNMSSAHPLFRKGECLACHGGHVSVERLLENKVNMLCFDCHQKVYDGSHITPGHPLEAEKDPSREGKPMDCISCHNPHVSIKKKLMKFRGGMSMCSICHSK